MGYKEKIIRLVKEGYTYNEISKKLGVAKSTVSYQCKKKNIKSKNIKKGLNDELVLKIVEYYKSHTATETSKHFDIPLSTIKFYVKGTIIKKQKLTKDESKRNKINSVKKFRKRLKEKAVEYKGGKCIKCGYNNYIGALEFHHRDPKEKDFSIGQYTYSWERVKAELDKCDLLCANCHREIHQK